MPHPLVGDLTVLTDDELRSKFNELYSKMNQAYRLGYGDAVHQMQMIFDDYKYELDKRNQKLMDEMVAKTGKYKNIIDIQ